MAVEPPRGYGDSAPAVTREAGALGPPAGLGTPGWWAGLGSDVPVAAVVDPAFGAVPAQPEVLAGPCSDATSTLTIKATLVAGQQLALAQGAVFSRTRASAAP